MNKALRLLGKYIIYFVTGSLFSTFFYYMYELLVNHVAERNLESFSILTFLRCLVIVAGSFVILSNFFVEYFAVKHSSNVLQCLAYILMTLIFWNLVLPVMIKTEKVINEKYELKQAEKKSNGLSKNLFRGTDGIVYYFTRDYNPDSQTPSEIPAVIIDTNDEGYIYTDKVQESLDAAVIKGASPYRDIVVKNIFSTGNLFAFVSFDSIRQRASDAFSGGILKWLEFLSLALALSSIYGLSELFSWKLINAVLTILCYVGILVLNTVYYLPSFAKIRESAFANGEIFALLGKVLNEPLLCLFNVVFGLVCIAIGTITYFVRTRAKKVEE